MSIGSLRRRARMAPSRLRGAAVAIALGTAAGLALAQETEVKIKLTLDGTTGVPARLVSGAAARDFAALLPLDLTLKDHAATEKIADLPKRLSTSGAPASFTPTAGTIAYYAPWGNLALFYRDFRDSAGLVELGRLENASDVPALRSATSIRIERVE